MHANKPLKMIVSKSKPLERCFVQQFVKQPLEKNHSKNDIRNDGSVFLNSMGYISQEDRRAKKGLIIMRRTRR